MMNVEIVVRRPASRHPAPHCARRSVSVEHLPTVASFGASSFMDLAVPEVLSDADELVPGDPHTGVDKGATTGVQSPPAAAPGEAGWALRPGPFAAQVDAWLQRFGERLFAWVRHEAETWSSLRAHAEDVAAEVVMHVLVRLRAVTELPRNLGGWLARVVKHQLIDQSRRLKRRQARECMAAADDDEFVEGFEATPDAWFDRPDRAVERERLARRFGEALEAYVARAEARGGRGHQVRAWLATQLGDDEAEEFAQHLRAERAAEVRASLVWKWVERGRKLLLELAACDADRARGEFVTAVVEGLAAGV